MLFRSEQISDFLLTGAVTNAINLPSVSGEEAAKLRPYMELASKLGSYLGQLNDRNVRSVTIEYEGQASGLNVKPLTSCVLAGFLGTQLATVNMVNAPALARERAIDVIETRHRGVSDYLNLIRVTVDADGHKRKIAGSVFGASRPRIVQIAEIAIEAEFGKHMIYVRNEDKPGFIGRLGTLLGESKVNIATFHLGRDKPGGSAIALVQVDQPLSAELTDKIASLQSVVQAKALGF